MFFWLSGCTFSMFAVADRYTDQLQIVVDDDLAEVERSLKLAQNLSHLGSDHPERSLLYKAKQRAKKNSKRFVTNIHSLATALNRGIAYLSSHESSSDIESEGSDIENNDQAEVVSELWSDFGSDDERSKYGINAVRRPFF